MTAEKTTPAQTSIRNRLFLIVVVVVSAIFLSLELYRVEKELKQYQQLKEANLTLLLDNYVNPISTLVWNLDYDQLPSSLAGLSKSNSFAFAKVTDGMGKTLYLEGHPDEFGSLLVRSVPLTWEEEGSPRNIGRLEIGLTLDELDAVRNSRWINSLTTLAAILAPMLTILYFAIRRLTGPLGQITQTIESVANDGNTPVIPYQSRMDEVGTLARALEVFRNNRVELDNLRRSLEERVTNQTRELLTAKNAAEAGNLAKSRFLSTVSHELRTPLTSISGALKMLAQDRLDIAGEQRQALLSIANRNADRLLALVNDILDLQKIEAGKMQYEMTPVSLDMLLKQSLEAMSGYTVKYQSKIQYQRLTPSDLVVVADAQRISQVILNLLSNAVKFSPIRSTIHLTLDEQDDTAMIKVIDQGAGIPETFRNNIFKRFTQSDSADTRQAGGTGLGLAIVMEIIRSHGGQIDYQNLTPDNHPEHTQGACFWFTLPIIQPQDVQTHESTSNPADP